MLLYSVLRDVSVLLTGKADCAMRCVCGFDSLRCRLSLEVSYTPISRMIIAVLFQIKCSSQKVSFTEWPTEKCHKFRDSLFSLIRAFIL